ncbi:beta-1,6-glucan boisynthesis protein-like protein [Tothia fuscella]|uniref:Beta-1,6-glucan boisynthesis protein-like protein n=1 Tax=Tothia fuscella TaxID=1048955 RepID=A0A9P4NU68_9PEZI|nr:beta-1,6-glucan boisynthesis protein-like protein [Tothia fuscella]
MRLFPLSLLAAIVPTILADVQFTSPAPGSSFTGGGSIKIAWKDSGDAPSISDLATYQLFLCAGGNEEASIVQLYPITDRGIFANGNKAEGTIPVGIGASTPKNAYFLKMISVGTTGGTVTNYSPRFSMTDMTGSFPAAVVQSLKTITGTDGPASVNAIAGAQPNIPAGAAGAFTQPFRLQTGPIRYAPMQTHPPTKITKKNKTPLNPTSPYKVATTFLPLGKIQTTITQSITWTFSQAEHTVAAAAQPTDPMQRFLNRWKD